MSLYKTLTPTDTTNLPSIKLEEYRYSSVLPFMETLNPIEKGSSLAVPWKSDFVFAGGMEAPKIASKLFTQLPSEFHRYKNYFKNAGLVQNANVTEISFPKDKDELHLTFTASKASVNTHKAYVHVGEGRKVQLYVHFACAENSLMIPQIYLDAQKDSHIELIYAADKTYNEGVLAPFIEMISQDASHASFQSFTDGIKNQRISFMGYVKGAESHIDLRTGFYLKDQESCDLFIRIFHDGEGSTSNQMIKAVTLDEAQINFNAQIYASPKAHNIYAYQKLTGMILGEKSRIFARPQLDIEYYELACSHGVSIGGFDPEELFYAESRGIPKEDVYPLLLYGFFGEPFLDMPLEKHWMGRIKTVLGVDFV